MFPRNKIMAAGGTQRTFMEILKFYDKNVWRSNHGRR